MDSGNLPSAASRSGGWVGIQRGIKMARNGPDEPNSGYSARYNRENKLPDACVCLG